MGLFSFIFGRKEKKDNKVQSHRQEPRRNSEPVSSQYSHESSDWQNSSLEEGLDLEGTISKVLGCGILVDVGRGLGFVHVSNMSCGFLTKEDIAAFYHEGQKVHVVVLGYNEKKQLQLGIKQILKCEYEEGEEIMVLVRRKSETNGLESITTDENHIKCFIPADELSWKQDKDADDFIGQSITVKVLRFNTGFKRLTGSIRQMTDPWTTPNDIKEGKCIEVRVTAHQDKGILISTINEGIPGRIFKNQITWLVADDDITNDDYPKINDIVRAVVTKFNPQAKKLNCSLRELQPNPWYSMQAGKVVSGTVINGEPGNYTVRLENGIKCKCGDKVKMPLRQSIEFMVKTVDTISRTAEVSKQAIDDNLQKMNTINDFFNNRVVRRHAFIIKGVVLFPQDVLCDGNPIAMPFALKFIDYVNSHPECLIKYKEIGEISTPQANYTRIMVDVRDLGYHASLSDIDALRNAEVNVRNIVTKTENGYIVQVACRLGYIAKGNLDATENIAEEQKARFVAFGDELCLDRIDIEHEDIEGSKAAESNTNLFHLDNDEIEVLDENDRAIIEAFEDSNPKVNKENINRVDLKLYVSYNPDTMPQLRNFLESDPDYFASNNFWLTSSKNEKDIQSICIYDHRNVMLVCSANDRFISVHDFYHDRQLAYAQQELNHNKHPLFLPANNLHLCKMFDVPGSFNAEEVRLNIARQYDIFTRILPNLSKKIIANKRTIGRDYITMSQYLKYQQNIERKRLQGIELTVDSNHIRVGAKEGSREVGLYVSDIQCGKFFTDESDTQSVKVLMNGDRKCQYIMIYRTDKPDEFFLFFKREVDLKAFKENGIIIQPNANVYHLQIQQESVSNFVDKSDMLTRLEKGEIKTPTTDNSFSFFDSKFNNVEPENNQPLAIRKAVGNKDIFLIQGPPGTGKTSVIVEIIRQLVKKGQRVLVCSQAHSAVRNIYDRLRKADNNINIGFLDEDDTMRPVSFKDHQLFLEHNINLVRELAHGNDDKAKLLCSEYEKTYSDYLQKKFSTMHKYLVQYFKDVVHDSTDVEKLITEFKEEIMHLAEKQNGFYAAGHVSSLQVVMATCIGIGTDRDIKNSGVRFDTLIVDEAGKANLAETNVPMQLASKYILVGDDNQLPPYMDSEDVKDFKLSDEAKGLDEVNVEEALGMSLFEYFLKHPQFPKENEVLLNYQYRMNPNLGDKISDLFYGGKLHNGRGTERQNCDMNGFPDAVTFIDTGETRNINKYNPYEVNQGNGSICNPCEIGIICQYIIPSLENLKQMNGDITIGIIAPYNAQVRELRKALKDRHSSLADCVYTIDNVQGQEYDIVIVSFVRAFALRAGKKVGFLDDLRRLNVALSRAKKKLIMVGNIPTLTNIGAHYKYHVDNRWQPVEIFKRIAADATLHHADLNSIDKLDKNNIRPGYVFKDSTIHYVQKGNRTCCYFDALVGNETLRFALPDNLGLTEGTQCDVRFIALHDKKSDRPVFGIADPVIVSHDADRGIVRLADGSEKSVVFNRGKLITILLTGDLAGVSLPLILKEGIAGLNYQKLKERALHFPHQPGDKVQGKVIAKTDKALYIDCHVALGTISTNYYKAKMLDVGDTVTCRLWKKKDNSMTVALNLI